MIIVTGATGKLGRGIVEGLIDRVGTVNVGVSVRDSEKASSFAERGLRVGAGDFADPSSLRHAFEGATQVLVVSAGVLGEEGRRLHRNAIEAAQTSGARRVLYTSHMGSSATSKFAPMTLHAETEAMLQDSGMSFTALRNGFYADSAMMLLGRALETGELAAPEDGPISWTAHADLAEAAAIALATEEGFEGPTPPLTGPEALDLAAIARIASEFTGREIRRVVVSDADHRAGMIAGGVPEARADLLMGMFAASRRGDFAAVAPTLEGLLGRRPTTFREVLSSRLADTQANTVAPR